MLLQVNDMDGREYSTEKRNGTEMPIVEKIKATCTGIGVLLWYAALILFTGRPVMYCVIQVIRFLAFAWLSIQDWCNGGNNLSYLNPFYQLAQFPYSHLFR